MTLAQIYPDGTTINRQLAGGDRERGGGPLLGAKLAERQQQRHELNRAAGGNNVGVAVPLKEMTDALSPVGKTTLDASSWPIVHGSTGMRDNTPNKAPTSKDKTLSMYASQVVESSDMNMAQMLVSTMLAARSSVGGYGEVAQRAASIMNFNLADSNPVSVITQKLNDKSQLLWTSTIGNVVAFRQTDGSPALEKLAELDHGLNFRFHGSYAMVATTDGSSGFFTTDNEYVARFELRGNDKKGYTIEETGRVGLPEDLNPTGKDALVGITLTDDGTVVVCSKAGVLMAAAVHNNGALSLVDTFSLMGVTKTPNSHVSNSIGSEGQQVYIATQRELVRVDLDPATSKFVFGWATIYGEEEPWYVGRLGPGSGSTPTFTKCEDKDLVVITDGALPMNLLWYDAATGALAASKKVQFGLEADAEEGTAPTTSEQSVAVEGCKAFVVQNYMGLDTLAPDIQCAVGAPFTEMQAQLGSFCNRLNPSNGTDLFIPRACPSAFGCLSLGAALYEVKPAFDDPKTGLHAVDRVWTRPDVSCGTSIPLISTYKDSNVAYCVGAKNGSTSWSLLGLDMTTGEDRLAYPFYQQGGAKNFFSNPFYAGVESVGQDKIAIGSIGGVIYLSTDGKGGPTAKPAGDGVAASAIRFMSSLQSQVQTLASGGVSGGGISNMDASIKGGLIGGLLLVILVLFVAFRRSVVSSPRLPMASAGH